LVRLCSLCSPDSGLHVLFCHTTPCRRSTGLKTHCNYTLKLNNVTLLLTLFNIRFYF
jgi:hypothetical protein